MKAELINPFLSSTKNVIETMSGIKVRTKSLRLKEEKTTYGEVTGIIGMASDNVTGNMLISFSKPCILRIVAKMTSSFEKEELDKDIIDAVGELTNMICGGAKNHLSRMAMKFDVSLPTTLVGKNVKIAYMANVPIIVIPFMTEAGEFVVEANLRFR